jgi:hypothetical protein
MVVFMEQFRLWSVEEQLEQPEQSNKESNMKVSLDPVIDQQSIKIITKELLYSDEEEEEGEEEVEEIKPESISFVKREHITDPTAEITLECLMNKSTYLKYMKNQNIEENKTKTNLKDRKFYKKRIYDLTKQLMHNEPSPSTEISKTFENYINSCIRHFQILDKTDILQEDYANITQLNLTNTKIESIEEANKSMMRFVKMYEPNSLEKIVKRTVTKMAAPDPVLPKQKNINLKDPILRNKGICKKNNISNKYEDKTDTIPPK